MDIKNTGVKPDSKHHGNQLLRNPKKSYTFKIIYQIFHKIYILITFGNAWLSCALKNCWLFQAKNVSLKMMAKNAAWICVRQQQDEILDKINSISLGL